MDLQDRTRCKTYVPRPIQADRHLLTSSALVRGVPIHTGVGVPSLVPPAVSRNDARPENPTRRLREDDASQEVRKQKDEQTRAKGLSGEYDVGAHRSLLRPDYFSNFAPELRAPLVEDAELAGVHAHGLYEGVRAPRSSLYVLIVYTSSCLLHIDWCRALVL